jgi:hypothetical protein
MTAISPLEKIIFGCSRPAKSLASLVDSKRQLRPRPSFKSLRPLHIITGVFPVENDPNRKTRAFSRLQPCDFPPYCRQESPKAAEWRRKPSLFTKGGVAFNHKMTHPLDRGGGQVSPIVSQGLEAGFYD